MKVLRRIAVVFVLLIGATYCVQCVGDLTKAGTPPATPSWPAAPPAPADPAGTGHVAPSGRPRALLTAAQLQGLSTRQVQLEALRAVTALGQTQRDADDSFLLLVNHALARHVFDDQRHAAEVDRLLDPVQQRLAKLRATPFQDLDNFEVAALVCGVAYSYDLCHDDLPAARRASVADDLSSWGDKIAAALRGGQAGAVFGNYCHTNLRSLTVAAAALGPDPRADGLIAQALSFFEQEVAPALDVAGGKDGGCPEGIAYNRMSALALIGVADALTNVTGKDAWRISSWLEHNGEYVIHHLLPNDRFLAIGDVASDLPTPGERLVLGRLASVFDNPYYAQFARDLPKHSGYKSDPRLAGLDLVFVDPALQGKPIASLPPSKLFAGIGLAVMRESWDPGSTVVSFRAGPSISGHMHADQNSFTVFRDVPLALDSGAYDAYTTEHRHNYYRRSVAHNTILVHDREEKFHVAAAYRSKFGKDVANDGGQLWFGIAPSTVKEYRENLGIIETAAIAGHQRGPGWEYVCGEAASAYSKGKVKRFTRELVFLSRRGAGGVARVLVLDEVELGRSQELDWLLHTIGEPVLAPWGALVRNGPGVMAVVPLLPRMRSTVVGGPGREFMVDGKNYAPIRLASEMPPVGAWRLELTPERPAVSHRLATMLLVGAGAEQQAGAVQLDHQGGALVITSSGEERVDYVVVGENGTFTAALRGLPANSAELSLLVHDLRRARERTVRVDADRAGAASLALDGRGPHLVRVGP